MSLTVLLSLYPPQLKPQTTCIYLKPLSCDHLYSRGGYVQDERYIAREHMDVRRDCVSFAQPVSYRAARLCQLCTACQLTCGLCQLYTVSVEKRLGASNVPDMVLM